MMDTRKMQGTLLTLLLLSAAALLQGCSNGTVLTRPGEAEYAPAYPVSAQTAAQNSGSIYQAATSRPLFEDIKARQVGDLLTVILDEQTDASKKATTDISKDTGTDISAPTVLGNATTLNGNPLSTSLGSSNSFTGASDSAQSNKLQGNITVSVAQVLPNGNLVIQGEKWISINQGDEYVRLRGIVRPVDIGPTNTVLSTQVANAQISYRGKGATADSNSMGWLARFFINPLWPF
jgi:flagellar L-ring protein precursor FlgH